MKIYLCTRDKEYLDAWTMYCAVLDKDRIIPTMQSILDVRAEGLVSPANSFGQMTGGIDLLYRNYFGKKMEQEVQRRIIEEFDGELLVGQAIHVDINHPVYTYTTLISAPTMRVPAAISHTLNTYLATKAVLRLAVKLKLKSITFPGMGTGTGGVSPDSCAKQMAQAIKDVLISPLDLPIDIYEEQRRLVTFAPPEYFKVQFEGDN